MALLAAAVHRAARRRCRRRPGRSRRAGWPAGQRGARRAGRSAPRPRRSREAWKLRKVGLALLEEGVLAFFGFVGQVVQQGGVAGELLHASQALRGRVERRFEEADRRRALLEDLPGPLDRRVLELVEWHDGVDQTHVERFLGRVLAAQEPDLFGLLVADKPGQEGRAVARVERTDPGPGLAETGVVGGDGEVA